MAKTTRYLGFCPCCEGTFKVRSKKLVHHGYLRPGYGYIVGDCFGALETPHELSPDLAKRYLAMVTKALADTKKSLADLPNRTELRVSNYKGDKWWTVPKVEAPEGGYDWENDREGARALHKKVSAWDKAYRDVESKLKSRERGLTADVARMTAHVETWEAKPLTTVEEEKKAAAVLKAEREAKKRAAKDARLAKKVAGYQKRIDSALRTKNSSTLADIWESIQDKLPDIDRGLSKAEALAMVERDEVWEAFGLAGMTMPGWKNYQREDGPCMAILDKMKCRMSRLKGVYDRFWRDDDGDRKRLAEMCYEWPEALGGENKKGAKTLAEVKAKLEKLG